MNLVIIGLGYVGLPLASEACMNQMTVRGVDASPELVEALNAGKSHVDDLSDSDLVAMLDAGFEAVTGPSIITEADVIVICVPTPLSSDFTPDLSFVRAAARAVAENLQAGCLVVLESTTYPGTTEDVVKPILEEGSGLTAGIDFALAYSPERTDPGNPNYGLRNTPKVVGGLTAECTNSAIEFYGKLVDTVVPTVGIREAELSKLLENTYRHVNIALMNEMAVFCHELGIDLWAAIEAAKTKPFGYEAFYPGPGVGGHCIPIDPNYLPWVVRSVGYRFRFVELAQEISDRMPSYVAQRVQDLLNNDKKPVNGSVVLLLGVTYKANVSDQRETPARPLAACLSAMGAEVRYFDPHAHTFTFDGRELVGEDDLEEALGNADLSILVQAHNEIIESGALKLARRILDTRGVLSGDNVERL